MVNLGPSSVLHISFFLAVSLSVGATDTNLSLFRQISDIISAILFVNVLSALFTHDILPSREKRVFFPSREVNVFVVLICVSLFSTILNSAVRNDFATREVRINCTTGEELLVYHHSFHNNNKSETKSGKPLVEVEYVKNIKKHLASLISGISERINGNNAEGEGDGENNNNDNDGVENVLEKQNNEEEEEEGEGEKEKESQVTQVEPEEEEDKRHCIMYVNNRTFTSWFWSACSFLTLYLAHGLTLAEWGNIFPNIFRSEIFFDLLQRVFAQLQDLFVFLLTSASCLIASIAFRLFLDSVQTGQEMRSVTSALAFRVHFGGQIVAMLVFFAIIIQRPQPPVSLSTYIKGWRDGFLGNLRDASPTKHLINAKLTEMFPMFFAPKTSSSSSSENDIGKMDIGPLLEFTNHVRLTLPLLLLAPGMWIFAIVLVGIRIWYPVVGRPHVPYRLRHWTGYFLQIDSLTSAMLTTTHNNNDNSKQAESEGKTDLEKEEAILSFLCGTSPVSTSRPIRNSTLKLLGRNKKKNNNASSSSSSSCAGNEQQQEEHDSDEDDFDSLILGLDENEVEILLDSHTELSCPVRSAPATSILLWHIISSLASDSHSSSNRKFEGSILGSFFLSFFRLPKRLKSLLNKMVAESKGHHLRDTSAHFFAAWFFPSPKLVIPKQTQRSLPESFFGRIELLLRRIVAEGDRDVVKIFSNQNYPAVNRLCRILRETLLVAAYDGEIGVPKHACVISLEPVCSVPIRVSDKKRLTTAMQCLQAIESAMHSDENAVSVALDLLSNPNFLYCARRSLAFWKFCLLHLEPESGRKSNHRDYFSYILKQQQQNNKKQQEGEEEEEAEVDEKDFGYVPMFSARDSSASYPDAEVHEKNLDVGNTPNVPGLPDFVLFEVLTAQVLGIAAHCFRFIHPIFEALTSLTTTDSGVIINSNNKSKNSKLLLLSSIQKCLSGFQSVLGVSLEDLVAMICAREFVGEVNCSSAVSLHYKNSFKRKVVSRAEGIRVGVRAQLTRILPTFILQSELLGKQQQQQQKEELIKATTSSIDDMPLLQVYAKVVQVIFVVSRCRRQDRLLPDFQILSFVCAAFRRTLRAGEFSYSACEIVEMGNGKQEYEEEQSENNNNNHNRSENIIDLFRSSFDFSSSSSSSSQNNNNHNSKKKKQKKNIESKHHDLALNRLKEYQDFFQVLNPTGEKLINNLLIVLIPKGAPVEIEIVLPSPQEQHQMQQQFSPPPNIPPAFRESLSGKPIFFLMLDEALLCMNHALRLQGAPHTNWQSVRDACETFYVVTTFVDKTSVDVPLHFQLPHVVPPMLTSLWNRINMIASALSADGAESDFGDSSLVTQPADPGACIFSAANLATAFDAVVFLAAGLVSAHASLEKKPSGREVLVDHLLAVSGACSTLSTVLPSELAQPLVDAAFKKAVSRPGIRIVTLDQILSRAAPTSSSSSSTSSSSSSSSSSVASVTSVLEDKCSICLVPLLHENDGGEEEEDDEEDDDEKEEEEEEEEEEKEEKESEIEKDFQRFVQAALARAGSSTHPMMTAEMQKQQAILIKNKFCNNNSNKKKKKKKTKKIPVVTQLVEIENCSHLLHLSCAREFLANKDQEASCPVCSRPIAPAQKPSSSFFNPANIFREQQPQQQQQQQQQQRQQPNANVAAAAAAGGGGGVVEIGREEQERAERQAQEIADNLMREMEQVEKEVGRQVENRFHHHYHRRQEGEKVVEEDKDAPADLGVD